MIRAGAMPYRVTIQHSFPASPDRDAGGAPDESWVDLFSCWAEIMPLRGRELLAAQQVSSEVTGAIRVRYRADHLVTAKMRVLFGARIYDILAVVDPLEQHREWMLYVREGPSNG